MPLGVGLFYLMAFRFPTFFKPAFSFAILTYLPFCAWSCGLYIWVRRLHFSGDSEVDRHMLLRVTLAALSYVQVGLVAISVACLSIALHFLLWGSVIGSEGYAVVLVAYLIAFAGSFTLRMWVIQTEIDAQGDSPRTIQGRLLKGSSQLRVGPADLAGPVLAITALLKGLASQSYLAAVAGALALLAAFGLTLLLGTGYEKWRYLRRLREAEFGGRD
jgi:hypothetical protein